MRGVDHSARPVQAVVPFAAISAVAVLVAVGFSRGLWLPNLHNGLLALAFAFVGAYILHERPAHREGALFLATGAVEGFLFVGRQLGHAPSGPADDWWAWLGVWPVPVAVALTTLSVICFPDGRLPSPHWRWVAGIVVAILAILSVASAIWPVDYAASEIGTVHPLNPTIPSPVAAVWGIVAHPVYAIAQMLWVVAVVLRWRRSHGGVRRQVAWLVGAAAISVGALLIGLLVGGSPIPGLLTAALLPVAAGWAIVHVRNQTAYAALTWLSRERLHPEELPTGIARAAAEALSAGSATLWIGTDHRLEAVGVWPDDRDFDDPAALAGLGTDPGTLVRAVRRDGEVIGAISVARPASVGLMASERRLFDDLAAQAALVIAHLGLGAIIERQRAAGYLENLSPRERQVLDLMARGLSNAAICQELHLSIKTVEPVVSTIFAKLGLHADAGSNRRVLAVLSYLRR
jgi:DNA-binding CsgD family transcriptional regulator